MKNLLSNLWLSFFLGTVAHVLTAKSGAEEMEPKSLQTFRDYCKSQIFSHPVSSSVHTLRPSDIKAIAAIGSLGNTEDFRTDQVELLKSTEKDLIQESMKTLKDLVSLFNPSVQYYSSLGNSKAVSRNETTLLFSQAKEIVKSMKENQLTDYQNDWKLITVFHPCPFRSSVSQVASYTDSIKKLEGILDYLHKEVPKAFVNLVDSTLLTVSSLPHTDLNHTRLNETVWRWSYLDALEKLLASMKYELKNNFTVVLQTSLQEENVPFIIDRQENDYSTEKIPIAIPEKKLAGAALGIGIWNNMILATKEEMTAFSSSGDHFYFFFGRHRGTQPASPHHCHHQRRNNSRIAIQIK